MRPAFSARGHRLAALFVPGPIVALVVNGTHGMLKTASLAVFALWITMCGGLFVLALEGGSDRGSRAERVDVLTAGGAAMMWTSAGAIMLATVAGWASLAVVGVLGMGTVCLSATWLALVTGSQVSWKRAQIERSIAPASALEGDPLREHLKISNVRIPPGMRLFARGRALPNRPESRYVVEGAWSSAELELTSDLGPAPRGEHVVPTLAFWLGDVLGLVRSTTIYRGECELLVLPKPIAIDQARRALGMGGHDGPAAPVYRQPTEGSFRMREYMPGDDTRRIHWVRSLQQDRLVVRLPDEIPPADPTIRLVLDNDMIGGTIACEAATELLDALVRVWLGVGEALAATGARVTLVTAMSNGSSMAVAERGMSGPASRDAASRFAARVEWQSAVAVEQALGAGRAERQIIVSCRPRHIKSHPRDVWIVVPDVAWTTSDPQLLLDDSGVRRPFPSGSAENRVTRREREHALARARWLDRSAFGQVTCWVDWTRFSGHIVARPDPDRRRAVLEVIP